MEPSIINNLLVRSRRGRIPRTHERVFVVLRTREHETMANRSKERGTTLYNVVNIRMGVIAICAKNLLLLYAERL